MKKNKGEQYFVYGFHTIMAILRFQPQRAIKLFVARKDEKEVIDLANLVSIPVEYLDRSELEKRFLVSSDAQGLVLFAHPFSYETMESLLKKNPKTLIALDSLQDNVNLGRIARSALCLGADGIIITKDRSAFINKVSEKASVGALARIPVAQVTNLSTALKNIKDEGFFVYGASEKGSFELSKVDFANKVAIVIGQEGEGLRELTKKNCDMLVNIPMKVEDICLNAADAALLFLYQLNINEQNNV